MRLFPVLLPLLIATAPLFAQAGQPWLGVRVELVEAQEARQLGIPGGLRVSEVVQGSPAEEEGLEPGDILLSVGGRPVTTIESLQVLMRAARPGDVFKLGVRRSSGQTEPMEVMLGSLADRDPVLAEDEEYKRLRERQRELDRERHHLQEEIERRRIELGRGTPEPQVERPEPAQPEPAPQPRVEPPERATLRVQMGARMVDLRPDEAASLGLEGGARVTEVTEGGAAAEAGLKAGDVVVKAGERSIAGTGDLRAVLLAKEPGDKLILVVHRDGEKQELTVVLRPREE
jgi:S1-C subfamily serine protease